MSSTNRPWVATTALAVALVATSCGSSDQTATTSSSTGAQPSTSAATAATSASSSVPTSVVTSAPAATPATTSAIAAASSTTAAPAAGSCSGAELPPAGSPHAPVMVTGISANDSDGGLNIRFDPNPTSPVQFALPNGSGMATTGLCEKSSDGTVWWAVEDGHWSGWASSQYLTHFVAGASVCPSGTFNPIGKGTVGSVLGDYDGDGAVDALFLAYDGAVQAPNAWTGSTATLQIQFADGGLSTELDISGNVADGGPAIGITQLPGFPKRIDPANTWRSVAVLSSTYAGSATGAGLSHFIGVDGCNPRVLAEIEVTPSAGSPARPIVCDVGGGGRVQLYALEGLSGSFDYLVTEYDFLGNTFVPQPQTTAGNANTDPDPTVC